MKVRVDRERCRGHALCFGSLPQIFLWDDENDRAHTDGTTVPAALEADVLMARDGCPEQAIVVEP